MKKRYKFVLGTALAAGAAALANQMIYLRAGLEDRFKKGGRGYSFRYGKVRYIINGAEDKPPLLLVHNAGLSLLEWQNAIEELGRDYRVYALDLLGFGYSEKPNVSYSSYLYALLLTDFVQDVVGGPVYAVGSGFGGAFLMAAASLKPELFSRVLMVNPSGLGYGGDMPDRRQEIVAKILRLPIIGETAFNLLCSRRVLYRILSEYAYSENLSDDIIDRIYYAAHYGGSRQKFALSALVCGSLNVNIAGMLREAAMPVHIILGGEMSSPIESLPTLTTLNHNITALVVDNARALPHDECPSQFCRECREFFHG